MALAHAMISLSAIGLLLPERDWRMDKTWALINCHTKPENHLISIFVIPNYIYFQKHTKGQNFVGSIDIRTSNTNQGELNLLSEVYSIVAVLNLLHLSSHSLPWWVVHLLLVNNSWRNLIEQLQ